MKRKFVLFMLKLALIRLLETVLMCALTITVLYALTMLVLKYFITA